MFTATFYYCNSWNITRKWTWDVYMEYKEKQILYKNALIGSLNNIKKTSKFSIKCLLSDLKTSFHPQSLCVALEVQTEWPWITWCHNTYQNLGHTLRVVPLVLALVYHVYPAGERHILSKDLLILSLFTWLKLIWNTPKVWNCCAKTLSFPSCEKVTLSQDPFTSDFNSLGTDSTFSPSKEQFYICALPFILNTITNIPAMCKANFRLETEVLLVNM